MKKHWILIVVMALLLVVVGCSDNGSDSNGSGGNGSGGSTPPSGNTGNGGDSGENGSDNPDTWVSDELVTIELMNRSHETNPTTGEEPLFSALQERTNVKLDLTNITSSSYEEKFQVTLASGNMPDIMETFGNDAKIYGMEGAFMPLNDLLEEHGQNILAALEEQGLLMDVTAIDGNIYSFPLVKYDGGNPNMPMIRKDWLDELGLDMPETTEEFREVLRAFKDNNMGGNNTIPYTGYNLQLQWLFNAFGINMFATNNFWVLEDGEFHYAAKWPEMEEALKYLNELYNEGLIDREFASTTKAQWEAKISTSQAGATNAHPSRADFFTQVLSAEDPEAVMVGFAPLEGPDGHRGLRTNIPYESTLAITSSSEHAEEIIKFYDYLFSEEGRMLVFYGVEGETYTMEDGDPEYIEDFISDANALQDYGMAARFLSTYPLPGLFEDRHAGSYMAESVAAAEEYYVSPPPVLNFNEEELDLINANATPLADVTEEYIIKFMQGQETDFQVFIDAMKDRKMEELEEAYNNAYQRALNSAN